MALHRTFAGEGGRNHHGLEMHIILAFDQRPAAGQTSLDELRDLSWIHGDAPANCASLPCIIGA
jgi:hypothetical protein